MKLNKLMKHWTKMEEIGKAAAHMLVHWRQHLACGEINCTEKTNNNKKTEENRQKLAAARFGAMPWTIEQLEEYATLGLALEYAEMTEEFLGDWELFFGQEDEGDPKTMFVEGL